MTLPVRGVLALACFNVGQLRLYPIPAVKAGSLSGATVNYWPTMQYGRQFFEKYGRYLLIRAVLIISCIGLSIGYIWKYARR
jgi:membrane protein DedA with SNARE-associated domain